MHTRVSPSLVSYSCSANALSHADDSFAHNRGAFPAAPHDEWLPSASTSGFHQPSAVGAQPPSQPAAVAAARHTTSCCPRGRPSRNNSNTTPKPALQVLLQSRGLHVFPMLKGFPTCMLSSHRRISAVIHEQHCHVIAPSQLGCVLVQRRLHV